MFHDRVDAAQRLRRKLKKYEFHDPLVLGIPRGGIVTAVVLSRGLHAEGDVILVRKLRAPLEPEQAVGAIAEDGEAHVSAFAEQVDADEEYLDGEKRRRMDELEQRRQTFREIRPRAELTGRSIILADDGIATGSTMMAAINVVREKSPHDLTVAVPVAPADSISRIRDHVDRVICLETPDKFAAVGEFYEQFDQVSDEQACRLLREASAVKTCD